MLSGTVASVIAGSQPPAHATSILIAGTTFQGLGILISVFMYSNYIGRLMSNGLPLPNTRPGMFISVGPPSFTGLAFIGMANAGVEVFPHTFVLGTAAVPTAQVLKIVAVFLAIVLWSLSLFFFCISLLATLNGMKKMSFHLVSEKGIEGVHIYSTLKVTLADLVVVRVPEHRLHYRYD